MKISPIVNNIRQDDSFGYCLSKSIIYSYPASLAHDNGSNNTQQLWLKVPPLMGKEVLEIEVYGTLTQSSGATGTLSYVLGTQDSQGGGGSNGKFGQMFETTTVASNVNPMNFKFNATVTPKNIQSTLTDCQSIDGGASFVEGSYFCAMSAARSTQTAATTKVLSVVNSDMQMSSAIDFRTIQHIKFEIWAGLNMEITPYIAKLNIYSPV